STLITRGEGDQEHARRSGRNAWRQQHPAGPQSGNRSYHQPSRRPGTGRSTCPSPECKSHPPSRSHWWRLAKQRIRRHITVAQRRRGPLLSALLVFSPSTMPDQNRNWHVNIEAAESRMTSFLPDASHHQTHSPGPPIFLSTLSRQDQCAHHTPDLIWVEP